MLASIDEIRAAIPAHRGGIETRLESEQPVADTVTEFSYPGLFDHVESVLTGAYRSVVASEDAHVRNLARAAHLRRESQEQADLLYQKQAAARQILSGYYGNQLDFELGAISGPTPRGSRVLVQQVYQTVKMLRKPIAETPAPRVGGGLDFETIASDLESGARAFLTLRRRYEQARKATDGTRLALRQRLVQVNRVFLWAAHTLEALFKLAGEPELADRIRTTARRLTRKQREEGTGSEPDAPAGDGEPATGEEAPAEPSESAEPATVDA